MSELKRVQVHLPEDLYDYLRSRAKEEGRKPGNLAAWLLVRALENEVASQSVKNTESATKA